MRHSGRPTNSPSLLAGKRLIRLDSRCPIMVFDYAFDYALEDQIRRSLWVPISRFAEVKSITSKFKLKTPKLESWKLPSEEKVIQSGKKFYASFSLKVPIEVSIEIFTQKFPLESFFDAIGKCFSAFSVASESKWMPVEVREWRPVREGQRE